MTIRNRSKIVTGRAVRKAAQKVARLGARRWTRAETAKVKTFEKLLGQYIQQLEARLKAIERQAKRRS